MRNRIGLIILALMLLSTTMHGCRSRELCPAYTDHHPATQEINRDKV